jgi:flagellar biosynthesis protein FlgN
LTHPAHKELLAALSDERVAVRDFVELLQHEQRLLTENDIEPLLVLAEQKSAHAIKLNELAEVCRRMLGKIIPSLDSAAIQAWLEVNSREGLAMWQEVRALAEQAKQLNNINGELIQMKLRHNQQALAALSGAVNQASLYGADGQSNFSTGTGRSLGSG